ncbi:MAG: hypothetical protein R8L53_04740 [Mariprofundales bacterium]
MPELSEQDTCYCNTRYTNAEFNESLQKEGIPEGFCGMCCICGQPGHTKSHPHHPYTSAWCDKHWQDVLQEPSISPIEMIIPAAIIIITISIIITQFL